MKKKITNLTDHSPLENRSVFKVIKGTTDTDLIDPILSRIPTQEPVEIIPIVQRLSGILSQEVSLQDYREHLKKKHGQ